MILVFAGAGASSAVDCEKYPTTAEFFRRVPSAIKKNPWFSEATFFLQSINNGDPIDIEQVLGALREMREYCAKSLDIKTFPGWVLASGQNRFSRLSESNRGSETEYDPYAYLDDILDAMRRSSNSLEELQGDIDALVYDMYAASPNNDALKPWITLFRTLESHKLRVEVFTTNYDVVLEKAIIAGRLSETIGIGRVTDGIRIMLDPAKWQIPSDRPYFYGHNLLTKLHGSVDWQRDIDGRIAIGPPRFTGEHGNHIVIYPGFKGQTQAEPFVTFHNYLRSLVETARAAIFIGYAFRDEYINSILSFLPSGIPKLVINKKQPVPDQDFLQDSSHFGEGFSEESITAFLALLVEHGLIKAEKQKES